MNADAEQRDGYRTQHPEPDSGKRTPAQIHGAEANRDRPNQGSDMKCDN